MRILKSAKFFLCLIFLFRLGQSLGPSLLCSQPTSLIALQMLAILSQLYRSVNGEIFTSSQTFTWNGGRFGSIDNPITNNYDEYINKYKPSQANRKGSDTYFYRNYIYSENVNKMNSHNIDNKKKYQMGLNQFSDIQINEFRALYAKLVIPDTIIKPEDKLKLDQLKSTSKSSKTTRKLTAQTDATNQSTENPQPQNRTRSKTKTSITNPTSSSSSASSSVSSSASSSVSSSAFSSTSSSASSSASSSSSSTNPIKKNLKKSTQSPPPQSPPPQNPPPTLAAANPTTTNSSTTNPTKKSKNNTSATTTTQSTPTQFTPTPASPAPTFPQNIIIDWTCKTSPVINQGLCGSCYIIAALQSIYMTVRMYNTNESLPISPFSIQEVLSCGQPTNGIFGCEGGYFISTYEYTRVNGTGKAVLYPYNSQALNLNVATPCDNALIQKSFYKISKFKIRQSAFIPYGDCAALINQLKTQAIAVSISTSGLQFYVSGTFNTASQPPNHGVTLVGYNPEKGYRIKNSWGPSWGDGGFAFVSESTGICNYAVYPVTGFENQPLLAC